MRSKGFVIALGAAAGGVVLGATLGLTGVLDLVGEGAVVALPAEAPIHACPAGDSTGVLIRGDRVYATGRDASGAWIEIRSPASSDSRVWIRAAHLTPDADLGALPVIPCGEPVTVVVETTVPDTTTTTVPDTTTTTVAGTTTTTTPATTTTTLPPAPSVGPITTTHNPIWEENIPGDTCNTTANQFTTTQISATITAPAGIDSVTMLWSVAAASGQKPMSLSGGQYRATLGPFAEEVLPPEAWAPINVTVRVIDDLGRVANRSLAVTLEDCFFG